MMRDYEHYADELEFSMSNVYVVLCDEGSCASDLWRDVVGVFARRSDADNYAKVKQAEFDAAKASGQRGCNHYYHEEFIVEEHVLVESKP